jgi:hypothetical protein
MSERNANGTMLGGLGVTWEVLEVLIDIRSLRKHSIFIPKPPTDEGWEQRTCTQITRKHHFFCPLFLRKNGGILA